VRIHIAYFGCERASGLELQLDNCTRLCLNVSNVIWDVLRLDVGQSRTLRRTKRLSQLSIHFMQVLRSGIPFSAFLILGYFCVQVLRV
jgi:hypothetical protein